MMSRASRLKRAFYFVFMAPALFSDGAGSRVHPSWHTADARCDPVINLGVGGALKGAAALGDVLHGAAATGRLDNHAPRL